MHGAIIDERTLVLVSGVQEERIRTLARDVSRELLRVLPNGFNAHEQEGQILLDTPSGPELLLLGQNISENLKNETSWEDVVSHCLSHFLNEVQDIVTEFMTVPWPQYPEMEPGEFALPQIETAGRTISFWYGKDRSKAVILSVGLS